MDQVSTYTKDGRHRTDTVNCDYIKKTSFYKKKNYTQIRIFEKIGRFTNLRREIYKFPLMESFVCLPFRVTLPSFIWK